MNNDKLHIMICGSRKNYNRELVVQDITQTLVRYRDAIIHHGGAVGVDSITESCCKCFGITTVIHKPDYEKYGKSAPLRRNEEMIAISDRIFAFWNGESPGTKFVINWAIELKVPLVIFYEGKKHA